MLVLVKLKECCKKIQSTMVQTVRSRQIFMDMEEVENMFSPLKGEMEKIESYISETEKQNHQLKSQLNQLVIINDRVEKELRSKKDQTEEIQKMRTLLFRVAYSERFVDSRLKAEINKMLEDSKNKNNEIDILSALLKKGA